MRQGVVYTTSKLIPIFRRRLRRRLRAEMFCAGMTETDVRASIGEPDEISSTETNPGAHEQWYYKTGSPAREYLNFDDGVLTSWRSAH